MRPQGNLQGEGPGWGATDIRFSLSPSVRWGIDDEPFRMALELLHIPRRGAIADREPAQGLAFEEFEALLKVLYPDGDSRLGINEAIRLRYRELTREQRNTSP